ncbi:MAG: hypothetical protein U7123_03790 [Potamolinea sp.]
MTQELLVKTSFCDVFSAEDANRPNALLSIFFNTKASCPENL